jgi:hypothetical protein
MFVEESGQFHAFGEVSFSGNLYPDNSDTS